MGLHKSNEFSLAAYLLYTSSIIGLIALYTPKAVNGHYTNLVSVDVIAYIVLFVVAYFIHMGLKGSRTLYAVLAVVWYGACLFYLPEKYGHSIDLYSLFIQILLVLGAYVAIFSHRKNNASRSASS